MLKQEDKTPKTEQEGTAPSVTNLNCYRESSKFFLLIHQSTSTLLNISLDVSYPMRDFCRYHKADEKEYDDYSFKALIKEINKAEEEAQKLARQCAEIRRRLTGKEAQDV
jgi:hypothetical protein